MTCLHTFLRTQESQPHGGKPMHPTSAREGDGAHGSKAGSSRSLGRRHRHCSLADGVFPPDLAKALRRIAHEMTAVASALRDEARGWTPST